MGAIIGIITALIPLVLGLAVLVGVWKTFVKAGQPGWACIIPIYNIVCMLNMARKPVWWLVLLLIPIVGIVVLIMVNIEIAKGFGKGVGTALLMFIGIGWLMLGYGDAQYNGVGGGGGEETV
jgi:hypothetical protein